MGKMTRKESSNNTLSREQVSWVIFGESLLSGISNPFGDEVQAEQAYLANEKELIRIYAQRHPGRRPIRFWDHHPRKAIGTAAYLRPDGQVRITPVLESDAQFLWRTKTYLPFEKIDVERKAIADSIEQQQRIENLKSWVAAGDGAKISRVEKNDAVGLSQPVQA